MKEKQKKLIVMSAVILAIIGILYFGVRTSTMVAIQGVSPTTQSATWNNYSVIISTIFLGDFVSSNGYDVCNDNDGKVKLSNSFNTNKDLVLSSSISSTQPRCGTNYITGQIILPKGKITAICKLVSNNKYGDSWGSNSSCIVGDRIVTLFVDTENSLSKQETITIDLNESTTLDLTVLSYTASNGGLSNATLSIGFKPSGGSCLSGQKLCSDGTCKNLCDNTQDYSGYIIIAIIVIIFGGLYWIYKKSKKK
jgi:hypothetical protein